MLLRRLDTLHPQSQSSLLPKAQILEHGCWLGAGDPDVRETSTNDFQVETLSRSVPREQDIQRFRPEFATRFRLVPQSHKRLWIQQMSTLVWQLLFGLRVF